MADLGNDLACVTDIDPSLPLVEGRRALAEAIVRRWITPPGGLFYAPSYGAGLLLTLHGGIQSVERIATELQNEALKDERVREIDVRVALEGDMLRVSARVTDAAGPFRFVLGVSELTLDLMLEAT